MVGKREREERGERKEGETCLYTQTGLGGEFVKRKGEGEELFTSG